MTDSRILPDPPRDLDDVIRDQFGPDARVTGFVDAEGNPVDPEAVAAQTKPEPASVTLTIQDPEAFLDAFATVFGYKSHVPSLTDPRTLIPNPTSREDFAAAILRAYCDQIIRLARDRASNPNP